MELFGSPANSRHNLAKPKQVEYIKKLKESFSLLSFGKPQYFLQAEEEMIIGTLELSHERGFPYDKENLIALATSMLQATPKHRGRVIGEGWLRGFEGRYADRIKKVKSSSLDKTRADKASAKVRDECFAKVMHMIEGLKESGLLTDKHMENLGDHILLGYAMPNYLW